MRIFLPSVLAMLCLAGESRAQVLRAAPSGRATTEVTLSAPAARGSGAPPATPQIIRIDYGQPHLRGRSLHTDSLVPYGQPWRTGANALTTLRTDVDLTLGGVKQAKGTYAIASLPTRNGWTLIVQRNEGQNALEYNPSLDVARIALRRRELSMPLESLTFWLIPAAGATPARGEVRFAWGRSELSADWSVE